MEYVIKLLSLLLPYLKRKVQRPMIHVQVLKNRPKSEPKGFSSKNVFTQKIPNADDTIRVYEINWKLNIIMRNNSEYPAYYPKVYYEKNLPHLRINPPNPYNPITSNSKIVLDGEIKCFIECLPKNRRDLENEKNLNILNQRKLLVEYANSSGMKFYTLYELENNVNKYFIKKPKRFKWIEISN